MHNFQSNRDLERKLGSLAKVKHIKTETTLKEAKKQQHSIGQLKTNRNLQYSYKLGKDFTE